MAGDRSTDREGEVAHGDRHLLIADAIAEIDHARLETLRSYFLHAAHDPWATDLHAQRRCDVHRKGKSVTIDAASAPGDQVHIIEDRERAFACEPSACALVLVRARPAAVGRRDRAVHRYIEIALALIVQPGV